MIPSPIQDVFVLHNLGFFPKSHLARKDSKYKRANRLSFIQKGAERNLQYGRLEEDQELSK